MEKIYSQSQKSTIIFYIKKFILFIFQFLCLREEREIHYIYKKKKSCWLATIQPLKMRILVLMYSFIERSSLNMAFPSRYGGGRHNMFGFDF